MTSQYIEEKGIVFDLETTKGCFLASFFPLDTGEYVDFLVCGSRSEVYQLVKFLENNKDRAFIGFNNINFDNQILEYIVDNYQDWYDLSSLQISSKISEFASDIIERQNYNLFLPYKEDRFRFKPIDVPRIFHWFNENRRVSLKQAEFELRAETIQNFDIDPDKEVFSEEEVADLIHYCHNDIRYTREIFNHVTGNTSHPLYKGRNKLVDRINFKNETNLNCLNWDDVKIGAEWNKLDYCKATGRKEEDLKPKKVNHFYGKKFKKFFPKTVSFQTDELKGFIEDLGEKYATSQKQEFVYKFNETLSVTIAKGGLHSHEKPRIIKPSPDEFYIQNDIGSQYPKAIIKFGIYPSHLGYPWLDMLINKVSRRLGYKKKYKETKDPVYNSLQETGKYALNGGAYGRLGLPGDWQEDPSAMLTVTLGCQLEIMMIVEALVLKGFNVTSCNTDGWDCIVPKDRLSEYFDLLDEYEKRILAELGTIEYTVFEYIVQTSVNDYVARKLGVFDNRKFVPDTIVNKESAYPDLKLKGDFTVDFELHKNSSFKIIPLALVEYFSEGTDPEEFILNHRDIFDFCARSNSGQIYKHFGYKDNKGFKLPKIIRYFVAKEGIHVKKIVTKQGHENTNDTIVQPKDYLKVVCNHLPLSDVDKHLQNINTSFYVDKVKETIFKIERGRKPRKEKTDPNQGVLF